MTLANRCNDCSITYKIDQISTHTRSRLKEVSSLRHFRFLKSFLHNLQIDNQVENRANDFLFQIIDTFSKILLKDDNEESGAIAKIIQQRDSPIFDLFFFLQRALPLMEESKTIIYIHSVQANEVPLINSIKHIKYLDQQAKVCDSLEQYLQQLIKYEGAENGQGENELFNFVVFPTILVLNVFELSQAKCNMVINQFIEPSALSNEQPECKYQHINCLEPFRYRLIAMIHCS